jgi:uncharacterized protein with HEPN domain
LAAPLKDMFSTEPTAGMDEAGFLSNKAVKLAVVKSIEIIGEASKALSAEFKEKHLAIPWSDIVKMRDKTVHFYFGIEYSTVWEVVKKDLPVLEAALKKAQGAE